MTITSDIQLDQQQHLVLSDVDWYFYEHVLGKIGNRPIRVTFFEGTIEIMAPLSRHEIAKSAIGRLIESLAFELDIDLLPAGSTTFRCQDKSAGLEPDECYYTKSADRVQSKGRIDSSDDPPPDLAVEIDITRRSIARQPIHAALGVPELWRFDGESLDVLILKDRGKYARSRQSLSLPFLPMEQFTGFVNRMLNENQNKVLRDFRKWVAGLPIDRDKLR